MTNKDNLVLLPSTKEEFSMDTFVDPITLESITIGKGDYTAEDIFKYSLVFLSFPKYRSVFLSIPKYYSIFLSSLEYLSVFTNTS